MSRNITFILLLFAPFLGIAQSYEQQIQTWRDQKIEALKAEKASPLAAENTAFLQFFPPDAAFRVQAKVTLLSDNAIVNMPTSDGTSKKFKRYAKLQFEIDKESFSLTAYENVSLFQGPQANYLFLPFLDASNGHDSYEGGRYIDLKKSDVESGTVAIDFNLAYNPYCAYSTGFRCPQPPKENFLNIAIMAGEKKYLGPKNNRPVDIKSAKAFNKGEAALINKGNDSTKMYILQTTDANDLQILSATSEDIRFDDPLIPQLKNRMFATVRDPEHAGVGIAAPQVGINRNLIWVQRFDKPEQPFEFYINPKIIWRSQLLRKGAEGCLSIPNRREDVVRSYAIRLQYISEKGAVVEENIEGFSAVIFQHEVDHLYGILFPDRITELEAKDILPLQDKMEFSIEKGKLMP